MHNTIIDTAHFIAAKINMIFVNKSCSEISSLSPEVVVADVEVEDSQAKVCKARPLGGGQVFERRVRDAEFQASVGAELALESVSHLGERGHLLAGDLHQVLSSVQVVGAGAGRDLLALGAVQAAAHGQPQQRVQEGRHRD